MCELIGIYILYLKGRKHDSKNIGLCRDGGPTVFNNASALASAKRKKQLQTLFKQKSLQILLECNLKIVNHLDVTFNLNDNSYRPDRKPNDEIHYILIQSDHPPSITKHFHGPSKSTYHNYHHPEVYFTKRYHIMSNVSPAVGITKN